MTQFLKIISHNPVKGEPSEYVNVEHIASIEPHELAQHPDKYHSMIYVTSGGVFIDARNPDELMQYLDKKLQMAISIL